MEKDKIENILKNLYQFYPELQNHEDKLRSLILEMIKNKPDTKFDKNFAWDLKKQLLVNNETQIKAKNNNFNFNIMNKKILIAAGSLIVASILFIAVINIYGPEKETGSPWSISSLIGNKKEEAVKHLPAGSFGSLANLSSTNNADQKESASLGLGSFDGELIPEIATAATNERTTGAGNGQDIDILPYYGFKYEYVGDELNLEETNAAIYRRLKNQDNKRTDLARTLSSFNFSGINLKRFDNLKVNNLSFSEDKEQGLMINFDLKEGNIYMYENWEKWRIAERDACGNNQACWDKFRVKIEDVPAEEKLIALSNNFLTNHQINLENYSEPRVDNNWRKYYDEASDKDNYYIPEQIAVIYPLKVEGNIIRDQSGNYTGLRLSINILHNKVSGLNGLIPYRYEASEYALEDDGDRIIALAENGGYQRNFYNQEKNDLPVVELGTPEKSYIQMWRYQDNKSEEILIPALIFPVTKKPEQAYYGNDKVVVPLVKELLVDLEEEQDNWLLRSNIEPAMPMPTIDFPGAPVSGTASEDVDDEVRIMPVDNF